MEKEFFQRNKLKKREKEERRCRITQEGKQGNERKKCEEERKIGLFSVSG
jgi:hypothetical protein